MAEMRRPMKGGSSRTTPSRGSGRVQGAPKKTSLWIWVGLVISPLILVGLIVNLGREDKTPPTVKEVKVDPNKRLKELQQQVGSFSREYQAWRKLLESEDPSAKQKQETLVDRINKWTEEWDGILSAHADPEGNLPPEYQGYQKTRAEVNRVRSDILKSSPF